MNYEIVNLEEKIIVGLKTRTGINDPECQKKISGVWTSLLFDGFAQSIKNKKSEYAYGVYSNYSETDYDVNVGMEVSKAENSELVTITIPAGKYAKFSIHGHIVHDVTKAWDEIWKMNLDRSFEADFEEYLNNDMENADINIYVSLK
jgi:predicted transcriptional regulator YdeE